MNEQTEITEVPAESTASAELPEDLTLPIPTEEALAAARAEFPEFDADEAMRDPAFLRLISPAVGLEPAEAYHLLHRREIRRRDAERAARDATEKLTAAILSGRRRPEEAGLRGSSSPEAAFDYRRATPQQRAEFKQRIRLAAARGEKLYPGK